MTATIGTVLDVIGESCPWEWADPWDNVGLVVGDPEEVADKVIISLDADHTTIARALEQRANLLVTHHPPFLEVPEQVTPSSAPQLFAALSGGLAIISAHTNLDRCPRAAGVLLRRLGLGEGEPIETAPSDEELITVYVPIESADTVRDALADVGAGRIEMYRGCSFSSEGEGRFVPDDRARPFTGAPGAASEAHEVRIEAVCPSQLFGAASQAIAAVHPYEVPLITSVPVRRARSEVALGRVTDLDRHRSLSDIVDLVAEEFECTPRVWGDPETAVARLATGTGSAGSLVPATAAAGADALLAGEVRYHDALDAISRGVAVIEAGHDVTEWPLVPILADIVATTPGLDEERLTAEAAARGWWTP
jgi:dinuclear metal center YbgI/SA1388 family protein